MKLFGAAVDGFESDPQFNPLTVMLAHSLTKYGVPPPETDDVGVWHDWYVEVKDRYHVSLNPNVLQGVSIHSVEAQVFRGLVVAEKAHKCFV